VTVGGGGRVDRREGNGQFPGKAKVIDPKRGGKEKKHHGKRKIRSGRGMRGKASTKKNWAIFDQKRGGEVSLCDTRPDKGKRAIGGEGRGAEKRNDEKRLERANGGGKFGYRPGKKRIGPLGTVWSAAKLMNAVLKSREETNRSKQTSGEKKKALGEKSRGQKEKDRTMEGRPERRNNPSSSSGGGRVLRKKKKKA